MGSKAFAVLVLPRPRGHQTWRGLRPPTRGKAMFTVCPVRKEAVMAAPTEAPGVIRSIIPARIDRLPWSPFHTRMVVALGVAWILDGLEITVASAVADTLTQPETLGLSSAAVGF